MSPIIENQAKKEPERKALGRGLAALLGNNDNNTQKDQNTQTPLADKKLDKQADPIQISQSNQNKQAAIIDQVAGHQLVEVDLSKIEANPDQPRKHFNQSKLEELALSLKEHGLVQPIIVKKLPNQNYQIIAGERRWRASKLAGIDKIPVIIRDQLKTTQSNDLASLIENVQREDLNPVELAYSFDRMTRIYGFTQDALAQKLGISRVHVANTLRLLKLPDDVKEMLVMRVLTEGHARALLTLNSFEFISLLAKEIVELGLTVREVESKIRQINEAAHKNRTSLSQSSSVPSMENIPNNPHAQLEEELRKLFGTKVVLKGNEQRGTVEIYFAGKDSLNRIVHQLRASQK
jgi:ParB family chromosome partitioning protein